MEPPLLPPALAQTWAEGMKGIPQSLLGGLVHCHPSIFNFYSCKTESQEMCTQCNSRSPLGALLLQ